MLSEGSISSQEAPADICCEERRCCILCGTEGVLLHSRVNDPLFGVPGQWSFRRCPKAECGLVWLDPQPREEDMARLYKDYYTHESSEDGGMLARVYSGVRDAILAHRLGYESLSGRGWYQRLEWLLSAIRLLRDRMEGEARWLQAKTAGVLLDLGCGDGEYMEFMHNCGWHVVGVEPDSQAVARAEKKGLEVYQGDVLTARLPRDRFDAITMNHVIEHVAKPTVVLRKCRDLLKPGGVLVMVTPNNESYGHRRFGKDWRGLEPPRHMNIYNERCLRSLTQKAALVPERSFTSAKGAIYILGFSRALRESRVKQRGEDFWSLYARLHRQRMSLLWMQMQACIQLQFGRTRGEELILLARKETDGKQG